MKKLAKETTVTWSDPPGINFQLDLIAGEVDALRSLPDWWHDSTEAERGTFELEWMEIMCRLRILQNSRAAGLLDSQQVERLESINALLGEYSPILDLLWKD